MNEYRYKARRINPIYFEPTEVTIKHYPGVTTQEIEGQQVPCVYVQAESIERFSTGERIERLRLFIPAAVLEDMIDGYDAVAQRPIFNTTKLAALFATKNMELLPDEEPVTQESPPVVDETP